MKKGQYIKCKLCEKQIYNYPYQKRIYCSRLCVNKSRKGISFKNSGSFKKGHVPCNEQGIIINCNNCRKDIKTNKSSIKNGKSYCSRKCLYESKKFKEKMKETMLLNRKIYKNKMGNHKQHKEETKIKISKTKKGIIPKSNKDLLLWIEKNGAWNKGIELPQLSGENHPNWLGGKSFEPYNKTFNNRFKKAIRKRDNRICLLCEIHSEKLKRVLDIHHINYDKLLSIPENCISLCNSCHMKTNFNRNHWTKFFQSLLSERYGYIYSEIGEPVLQLNNLINM